MEGNNNSMLKNARTKAAASMYAVSRLPYLKDAHNAMRSFRPLLNESGQRGCHTFPPPNSP
jgi:hypothetical protein